MKSKSVPYILLAVLAIVVMLIVNYRQEGTQRGINGSSANAATRDVNRNRGFDRRISFLEYTKHARCRMDCRKISANEVEYIMKEGKINYRKSNAKGRPCPTYALEGHTDDDQHVRIVFAQCNEVTKVVTCIDLEKEWQCACPGDDNKNKNQQY